MELFVSNNVLEVLSSDGKAEATTNSLKLEGRGTSKSFQPAVHILSVVSGDDSERKFVGTVRTESELSALGGELYHDSLLLNEDAYTVERGFLAVF